MNDEEILAVLHGRAHYQRGERIVDIARQPGLRYSPYLMARILVAALEPGEVGFHQGYLGVSTQSSTAVQQSRVP